MSDIRSRSCPSVLLAPLEQAINQSQLVLSIAGETSQTKSGLSGWMKKLSRGMFRNHVGRGTIENRNHVLRNLKTTYSNLPNKSHYFIGEFG
jgi:hypothetical protein